MEILDRILDRHDVVRPLPVDDVDERRERRRLPRTGRTGDEHETARQPREICNLRGKTELIEEPDLVRDRSERRSDRVALEVDVQPEPRATRERIRQVELQVVLELLTLSLRQDRVDETPDL